MKFSHLHTHTQYSLLDGACTTSRIFDKAIADGMPAVAITDHGNMFGVFDFVANAWKKTVVIGKDEIGKDIVAPQVKPIVGCEFYLVADRHKRAFTREEKDKRYHQLLLAKDEQGYKNLVKLCSLGYIEGLYGKYPRIDKELILKYHEGLIATTCCLGASVPRTILQEGEAAGEIEFKWWLDLFGDDFYVEFQRHGIPDQIKVNDVLVKWARKYNVPIIASNDAHYVEEEDANAHDILLCINTNEKQATPIARDDDDDDFLPGKRNTRFGFSGTDFYFKNTAQMTALFADIPEAIDNTARIVDKITPLKLEREILVPHFKVPLEFNEDQDAFLEHLTWTGAKKRYEDITPEIDERLRFELFTIKTMGFAGYFLIVQDFINHGKDIGVFVGPGRGSAAGSAVAYCIGITNIDPIKYDLLFERFLNPDRKSMPDIDTDFDDTGRQKVIDYVVEKYGSNQVAHIVTYGTMAAKSSIKDVARVKDLPLSEANSLVKLVSDKAGVKLKRLIQAPVTGENSLTTKEGLNSDDMEGVRLLREIYNEDSLSGSILREAVKLEGTVRNVGIHASAIIIAPQDVTDLLPVSRSKETNLMITQFDGSVIESAGMLKMDFLGLKTLSIIRDALELIKLNTGLEIDIDNLPLDDVKTYELFQRGDSNNTFQFESAGMQKHLRDLKPTVFADLIAMVALYRPGPMDYIPLFIRRKRGEDPIAYDLPEMEEYLKDTYGVSVYQEQVMLLSRKIANFSRGDADVLRKAMGKKQIDVLNKMKTQFMAGGTANGHPEKILEKIWTDWEAFASYAFNKSHATCYAVVAYQTGWLKAHYPAEYMAAVLNNQNSMDKIKFAMQECQHLEIRVLGPDVSESLKGFSVNKHGVVRFGMNAVKGVGEAAVEAIIEERMANGEFRDVYDFMKRTAGSAVNKRSLEALVIAGGFDGFGLPRAMYFHGTPGDSMTNMDKLVRFGQQVQASQSMTVNSLFGDAEMPEITPPQLAECAEWNTQDLLDKEKEMVGIYLSAHPLDGFDFELKNYGITPLGQAEAIKEKSYRLAGFVSDATERMDKRGAKFCIFTISDYSGSMEVKLFKEKFVNFGQYAKNGLSLFVQGVYEELPYREGVIEFQIKKIMLLEDVRKSYSKKLTLSGPMEKVDMAFVDYLVNTLSRSKGNTEFSLRVYDKNQDTTIGLKLQSGKIEINDPLVEFLQLDEDWQYKLETV